MHAANAMYDWLLRILEWIDASELPRIPYVGLGFDRFGNPPAPHLELCFMQTGSIPDLTIGELEVELPASHVSLHNVHFGNYSSWHEGASSWCVFLDVENVSRFAQLEEAPLFYSMPVRERERLFRLFEHLTICCTLAGAICPEYLSGPNAYDPAIKSHWSGAARYRIKAALLDLLAFLLETAELAGRGVPGGDAEAIRNALEYIGQHYAESSVTLTELANVAHLSVDHFGRLFRAHMNTTPMRYLQHIRITQSRFLLERTTLRVNEVATQVGFTDPLHFSRVFRSLTGKSPRAYRTAFVE